LSVGEVTFMGRPYYRARHNVACGKTWTLRRTQPLR